MHHQSDMGRHGMKGNRNWGAGSTILLASMLWSLCLLARFDGVEGHQITQIWRPLGILTYGM